MASCSADSICGAFECRRRYRPGSTLHMHHDFESGLVSPKLNGLDEYLKANGHDVTHTKERSHNRRVLMPPDC